jgi:glycosyltransferase involved in cell wall biosynthesis
VAVSDAVRNSLIELGARAEKVTTVRNGIAWQTLARNQDRRDALRRKLGIGEQTFVFGMLARLRPEKGIDLALSALKLLAARSDKECMLLIAGQGTDRAQLESLAKQLGVDSKVVFLGFVADPREVVSAFDSILFSSRLEGLPLGLLEGMAAGCVPIVTRISGMPEVVSDPTIGWLVEAESPPAIADAMAAASALNPFELEKMRRHVVEHIRTRFDLANSMTRIMEAFRL